MTPLAIDLYCGLGGWTEGLLAEGYRVVGFDRERHIYGDHAYPAQLVLQDVLTIHGRHLKDAALIVASPPCQEFSYMAMPWSKAKQKIRDYETGVRDVKQLTALFDACFRIQREASEAKGEHIPLVVENVRGAQRWVGRARYHFGSFYLWGDVPALMPVTRRELKGFGGTWFHNKELGTTNPNRSRTATDPREHGIKHSGARLEKGHPKFRCEGIDGQKGVGIGSVSWGQGKGQRHPNDPRNTWSKSPARKAASALIAKIPLVLARHVAASWHPRRAA